jgi:LEA14-like dessication related protein
MRAALLLLVLALIFATSSCSKPEPPVITPKAATVVSVDLTGMRVVVKVEIQNPNGVDLTVQSVTGRVMLDGKHDLGEVTVERPVTLPAKSTTPLDVPLDTQWRGVGILGMLAASNRAVPYTIDATARVGGERLNVAVPFRLHGVVTAEQLVQATMRSMPQLPMPPH